MEAEYKVAAGQKMVRGKKFYKAREKSRNFSRKNDLIPLKAGKTFWVP